MGWLAEFDTRALWVGQFLQRRLSHGWGYGALIDWLGDRRGMEGTMTVFF